MNQGSDRQIVFPFVDRIAQDLRTQGSITLGILVVLACISLLMALRRPAEPA